MAIFDIIEPVNAFFDIEKTYGVRTKYYKYAMTVIKAIFSPLPG